MTSEAISPFILLRLYPTPGFSIQGPFHLTHWLLSPQSSFRTSGKYLLLIGGYLIFWFRNLSLEPVLREDLSQWDGLTPPFIPTSPPTNPQIPPQSPSSLLFNQGGSLNSGPLPPALFSPKMHSSPSSGESGKLGYWTHLSCWKHNTTRIPQVSPNLKTNPQPT